jgi:hypothetical protein
MASIRPDELTPAHDADGMRAAMTELGRMAAAYYHLPAGYNARPHYRGLPGDMCPCTHWGYIVRGKIQMETTEGPETLEAGQLFHLTPGHIGEVIEDTEMVEFTPIEEFRHKSAHVARRIAELSDG